jgi:hypothetical protein
VESTYSTLAASKKSGAKAHIYRLANVAAEAATHKPSDNLGEMFYQLSWTTLPGLRGLSCSEFQATPTSAPDNDRGVAVDCANDGEPDALLAELETHFGPQRFLNTAAAFDAVKDYVARRAARG